MRITVIGSAGRLGAQVVKAATAHGHHVTGLVKRQSCRTRYPGTLMLKTGQTPPLPPGRGFSSAANHLNGFQTRTPRIDCPMLRSSVRSVRQPATAAASMTIASQIES